MCFCFSARAENLKVDTFCVVCWDVEQRDNELGKCSYCDGFVHKKCSVHKNVFECPDHPTAESGEFE